MTVTDIWVHTILIKVGMGYNGLVRLENLGAINAHLPWQEKGRIIMGLFKPAWMSKNTAKAIKVVERITDQTTLIEISKTALTADVQKAANKKLQSILANLSVNGAEYLDCYNAVHNDILTDEELLLWVAFNAKYENVLDGAIKKINSQDRILHIVNTANSKSLRCAAIRKLTNQAVLAEIAKNDNDNGIRLIAIKKLTNQAILVDIAKTDKSSDVRRVAVRRLTDQTVLAYVSKNDEDYHIRRMAAEKLKDKNLAQSVYADCAKNGDIMAVQKLTDQSLLADVAKSKTKRDVISWAIHRLTDKSIRDDILRQYCGAGKHFWQIKIGHDQNGDTHVEYTYQRCDLCGLEKDKKYTGYSFRD
jgi:hypothetical protein